jgi:NCS1 family nucleobase:cation symporter-1
VIRGVLASGWFGIQTFIGGEAIVQCFKHLELDNSFLGNSFSFLGLKPPSMISCAYLWLLQIIIIQLGMDKLRSIEELLTPVVLAMTAALLIGLAFSANDIGPLFDKVDLSQD